MKGKSSRAIDLNLLLFTFKAGELPPYLLMHLIKVGKMLKSQLRLQEDDPNYDGNLAVETAKPKLKPPAMYKVLMMNDDYTPMDFVVFVLQRFFSMDGEKANQVMLEVHQKGKGVCGIYPFDIAETKVAMVQQFVEQNEHPLMCDLQKVD